jgi:hypothetical protein
MGLDNDELAEASGAQAAAATDPSPHVRVIAGPGTGKSQTIGQRVRRRGSGRSLASPSTTAMPACPKRPRRWSPRRRRGYSQRACEGVLFMSSSESMNNTPVGQNS